MDRGRVAVVLGGASGIGKACAELAKAKGLRVVVADINAASLEALKPVGFDLCVQCDATQPEQVKALADQVYARFNDCGVLFSNTGIMAGDSGYSTPLAVWRKVLDVTFTANVIVISEFLPRILAQPNKSAAVVITSSLSGLLNTVAQTGTPYTVAKNASRIYAEALAFELKDTPVGVHCLCPGPVNTPLLRNSRIDPGKSNFAFEENGINEAVLENGLKPMAVAEAIWSSIEQKRFFSVVVDKRTTNASLVAEAMRVAADQVENGGPPYAFGGGSTSDTLRARLLEAYKRGVPSKKAKL